MKKSIAFIILSGCVMIPSVWSQINTDVTVDRKSFTLSERPRMVVTVSWQGDSDAYVIMNPKIDTAENITLERLPGSHETTVRGNAVSFVYRIEGVKHGKASTGEIRIPYMDAEKKKQSRVLSPVQMQIIEQSDTTPMGIAAGIAAVLVATGIGFFLVLRGRKKSAVSTDQTKKNGYSAEIKRIRNYTVTGDYKAFYTEVACLLLKNIQDVYGLKDVDRVGMEARVGKRNAGIIAEILDAARDVRFGGHKPVRQEMDRITEFVEEFFSGQNADTQQQIEPIRLRED